MCISSSHLEGGLDSPGAIEEEGHRRRPRQDLALGRMLEIRQVERWDRELAFPAQMQHGATGDQHLELGATASSPESTGAATTTCSKLSSSRSTCWSRR